MARRFVFLYPLSTDNAQKEKGADARLEVGLYGAHHIFKRMLLIRSIARPLPNTKGITGFFCAGFIAKGIDQVVGAVSAHETDVYRVVLIYECRHPHDGALIIVAIGGGEELGDFAAIYTVAAHDA